MKNLFKKLLACCMAVCMVLTLCVGAITVSAEAATGTVTAGTANIYTTDANAVVDVTAYAAGGIAAAEINVAVPADLSIAKLELATTDANVEVTYASAADASGAPEVLDSNATASEVAPNVIDGVFTYIIHLPANTVTTAEVTVKITFAGTFAEGTTVVDVVDAEACYDANSDLIDLTIVDGAIVATVPHVCTAGTPVVENEVPADCDTDGSYDSVVYCTGCGEELSRETIPVKATGHAYDDGVVTTQPDCDDAGVKTFTCANCGGTYTEAVSPLGHTAGEPAEENRVEAAPGVAGSYDMVVRCTVCNAIISSESFEIPALPEEIVPVLDENIVFNGEKMQFSNTINALLRISKSLVSQYASLEVVIEPTVYSAGNEVPGAEVVIPVTSGTTKNWNVYYEGIGMYAMALEFDAYVKCYDAQGNYVAYSNKTTYTPIGLIKAVYVNNPKKDTDKKLNALVTDTLNLATMAQTYFANQSQYKGSDLANDVAAGNVANKDWPQDYATTAYENLNTVNDITYLAPFTSDNSKLTFLSDLNGAPVFTCKFSKATTAFPDKSKLKLELSYTEVYGESSVVTDTIEGDEWQVAGKSYVAPASLVALYDGNKTVDGVLSYDGVEVIRFQYSLESYISENLGSANADFVNLLNSIAYFNVSSRAYFGTN